MAYNRSPYYDSPPMGLLDYPDGFANTKVIDLDAEYEEEQQTVLASAPPPTSSTEVRTADDGKTAKKTKGVKQLYHIVTDTQQRDFDAPRGLYGLYLSSYGPDPVNKVAEQLMSTFSKTNEGQDDEYDDYDNETNCYTGFSCFEYGGSSLSIMVEKIESDEMNILNYLYQSKRGLLQKVLQLFEKAQDNKDEQDITSGSKRKSTTTTTKTKLKQDDVIKSIQDFIDKK